ncbi:sidestep protein-like protein [Leptotrombidium deliense]|uniref:Sidestep protein-like protein n=1 Tax=Leptotrombidium deliense TaxID=299467 RepID=A0A443SW04_9ACAR|nr:sidestep protein-like protein [Leptotrombidium deliense]
MVRLPCNVTPAVNEDSIRLVLWYKEGVKGGPIYSFDARSGLLGDGRHFAVFDAISSRAYFDTSTNPAYLTLSSVNADDFGEYKCRVDFRRSRTSTTTVKLIVICEYSSTFRPLINYIRSNTHSII